MRVLLLFSIIPLLAQNAAPPPPQSPVDRAWDILSRGLHDGNPAKRVQDVSAMGIMRPQQKAVAMVVSALEDKDYSVRQAACVSLEQMKARQAIPSLKTALDDKAPEVAFAAAKALYTMGDPMGREVLVAVLLGDQADSSGFFKGSMHDMKEKMHDPKGLMLIGVKEGAGAFLGPASAGIPVAEGLMKDANASGKTAAVALLAKDTNPETAKAIREALGDKNWTVRAAAIRTLALNDRRDALKDIIPLMDDKKDEVTFSAAAAVIRLQPMVAARGKK